MKHDIPVPSVLTRAQVREVDDRAIEVYGLPGIVLMENAGRNAAELLRSIGIAGPVVICCGQGNNGGDGFVIARHLENAGIDIRVLLTTPPSALRGDAATAFHVIQRAGTPILIPPIDWDREFSTVDWIVDALVGTGFHGALREPLATVVNAINSAGRSVFAVDLPSGLNCDTGLTEGVCVRADQTATFVARKPAFDLPGTQQWTGQVHVLEIGVPHALLREISNPNFSVRGPD